MKVTILYSFLGVQWVFFVDSFPDRMKIVHPWDNVPHLTSCLHKRIFSPRETLDIRRFWTIDYDYHRNLGNKGHFHIAHTRLQGIDWARHQKILWTHQGTLLYYRGSKIARHISVCPVSEISLHQEDVNRICAGQTLLKVLSLLSLPRLAEISFTLTVAFFRFTSRTSSIRVPVYITVPRLASTLPRLSTFSLNMYL